MTIRKPMEPVRDVTANPIQLLLLRVRDQGQFLAVLREIVRMNLRQARQSSDLGIELSAAAIWSEAIPMHG